MYIILHYTIAFDEAIPEDLRKENRVTFLGHDFFTPQPVHGADVYVFKKVFHDWPDADVVRILRAQTAALHAGARILIIENVVDRSGINSSSSSSNTPPAPPVPRSLQRLVTAIDLRMMALYNARERSVDDFRRVLRDADPRFELASVKTMPKSELGVFEVIWRG